MDYSDTSTSTDDPAQSSDTGEPAKDQQEEETSGLLSKSFFKGKDLEVGGKCEIIIDEILDDEVICHYDQGHEDKKPEGSTMDKAKASMDRYAKAPEEM